MGSIIRYVTSLYGAVPARSASAIVGNVTWWASGPEVPPSRQLARLANRSADFEQACVALITAARRRRAPSLCALGLLLADEGKDSTKPLVLDNRALRDVAELIEGAVGEFDTVVAD